MSLCLFVFLPGSHRSTAIWWIHKRSYGWLYDFVFCTADHDAADVAIIVDAAAIVSSADAVVTDAA